MAITSIVVFAVLVTLLLDYLSVFSRVELASFDHRVETFRLDQPIHPDVVVILIDEKSLQALEQKLGRWPWPRSAYVELLDYFALAGAQSFALDILFTEQQTAKQNNIDDQMLIEATRRAANTVHSMQLLDSNRTGVTRELPDRFSERFALTGRKFEGPIFSNYLLPIDDLYMASRDIGYLELLPDSDGVYRRLRLFNRFSNGDVFPALSSAMVYPLFSQDQSVDYGSESVDFGELIIPLDAGGHYLINPYGEIQTFSAVDIVNSMQQLRSGLKADIEPAQFDGKFVLLGASAIGLFDDKPTAISSAAPGVLLHAYTVSNILQQDFLQTSGNAVLLFLLTTICGLIALIVIFVPRLIFSTLMTSTLLIGYCVFVYTMFGANHVLPLSPVIFASILALILLYSWRTWQENQAKQKVRRMLGQYVSPTVLTEVIDSQDVLQAEIGSTEQLSILFSDIRGFTNISETLEASKVVDLLNIYFSDMTEIIFHHKGTLDKFIGDAIMAFWGAPIKTEKHPLLALNSAIGMVRQLRITNAKLQAKEYPAISIGVGIHSGEVVLGNIGSERKLDYTVIGDSVNLASRLEGLTKNYGCPVIISETTHQAVCDEVLCIFIDRVRVKGKETAINLYAPAQLFVEENNLEISVKEMIARSEAAASSYLNGDWISAQQAYSEMGDCILTQLFVERCKRYSEQSPGDQWDGVTTFSTK